MPGLHSFPREERLTRRSDYLSIYRDGEKRVGQTFILYVVRREGQGRRVGFAVSSKVGKAVVRNRIKRFLREVYRAYRPHLADNLQMVLVARPAAATLDFRGVQEAVYKLFRNGDMLSE